MATQDSIRVFDSQEFCTTCQTTTLSVEGLQAGEKKKIHEAPHHKNFASFCAAIERGCYICTRYRQHELGAKFDKATASYGKDLAAQEPFTTYAVNIWPSDSLDNPPSSSVRIYSKGSGVMLFRLYRSQGEGISLVLLDRPNQHKLRSPRQTSLLLILFH